jgi:hypothetical protein
MVATGTSIDGTIQGFLVPQNEARRQVGVPPLKWDVKLTNYARTYARERRGDYLLQHSDGPFGENIFWGSGRGWNATEAVGAWVDEKKWYNYANNSCSSGQDCTHYTQIVWRTTTKVGARSSNVTAATPLSPAITTLLATILEPDHTETWRPPFPIHSTSWISSFPLTLISIHL